MSEHSLRYIIEPVKLGFLVVIESIDGGKVSHNWSYALPDAYALCSHVKEWFAPEDRCKIVNVAQQNQARRKAKS